MIIEIKQGLDGARSVKGTTIIVDIFRAGNTAAALLAAGAPYVCPVGGLEEARRLKTDHPDWPLIGERGGRKPDDFDLDNSPAQAFSLDLENRPAILTTSAGTQGLVAAADRAEALMMATLVNARAAVAYIRSLNPAVVTIVAMGEEARRPAVEDDAAADYLAEALRGKIPDHYLTARTMLRGPGADRLRVLGRWRDLAFCLQRDKLSVVPVAKKVNDRLLLIPVVSGK